MTDYLYRLTFGKEKEDHYSLSESKVTLSSFDGEIKPRDGVDYVEVE